MSLKQNIDMVKDELTSEEKFFEKAVITEKFVKKYKNVMIASVVVVVLLVAGNIAYTLNKQSTIDEVNTLLAVLETDASNTEVTEKLASLSPVLSDVWHYSQAVVKQDIETLKKLQDSQAPLIGDLASYEVAQNMNEIALLDAYAEKEDAIYADLAYIQSAILLMNKDKIDAAHLELHKINIDSPLANVANALMHYGVK